MHQPHPLPGRRVTLKRSDTVAEPRSRLVTLWSRTPRRAWIALVALVLWTALVQSLEHGLIALPAIVLVGGYYALLMTVLAMLGKRWWAWSRGIGMGDDPVPPLPDLPIFSDALVLVEAPVGAVDFVDVVSIDADPMAPSRGRVFGVLILSGLVVALVGCGFGSGQGHNRQDAF